MLADTDVSADFRFIYSILPLFCAERLTEWHFRVTLGCSAKNSNRSYEATAPCTSTSEVAITS